MPSPGRPDRGGRSMKPNVYRFDESWSAAAPPEAVWELVADPGTYAQWWPQFLEITQLNDVEGVGALVEVRVKSVLPYHMRFRLESTRYEQPHLAEVQASGDLNGVMRWTLAAAATGTRLSFHEEVYTEKRLLSFFAPIAKPLFAWNHRIMMKRGKQGLRDELARRRGAAGS